MEEIKYEYKGRGVGHVGDGECTRGDLVSILAFRNGQFTTEVKSNNGNEPKTM